VGALDTRVQLALGHKDPVQPWASGSGFPRQLRLKLPPKAFLCLCQAVNMASQFPL